MVNKDDKKVDKKPNFHNFVLLQLRKKERVKNVINVVMQDIYLFIERIAKADEREWEAIEKELKEVDKSTHNKPILEISEGLMNKSKDKAIRRMVIFELMRQYSIKLSQSN